MVTTLHLGGLRVDGRSSKRWDNLAIPSVSLDDRADFFRIRAALFSQRKGR